MALIDYGVYRLQSLKTLIPDIAQNMCVSLQYFSVNTVSTRRSQDISIAKKVSWLELVKL